MTCHLVARSLIPPQPECRRSFARRITLRVQGAARHCRAKTHENHICAVHIALRQTILAAVAGKIGQYGGMTRDVVAILHNDLAVTQIEINEVLWG